jgi:hypothetical protein
MPLIFRFWIGLRGMRVEQGQNCALDPAPWCSPAAGNDAHARVIAFSRAFEMPTNRKGSSRLMQKIPRIDEHNSIAARHRDFIGLL